MTTTPANMTRLLTLVFTFVLAACESDTGACQDGSELEEEFDCDEDDLECLEDLEAAEEEAEEEQAEERTRHHFRGISVGHRFGFVTPSGGCG